MYMNKFSSERREEMKIFKRILSVFLSAVILCTVTAGLDLSVFAESIDTVADSSETTTWKFLWVIAKDIKATAGGKSYTAQTSDNQSGVLKNYIIPNFEDYIYDYTNHYMKVESTFVDITGRITSVSDSGLTNSYWLDSTDIDKQLRAEGVNPGDYDQIVCSAYLGDIPRGGYWGLGGVRYTGTKSGYDFIAMANDDLSENGNITSTWKDSDGKLINHFCDVYVHEFMHCLESYVKYEYPNGIAREMPSPDGAGDYYSNISDLMEDFYRDFFVGKVPVSKGSSTTFGMTAWDYKNTPRTYNSAAKLGSVSVGTEDELKKAMFDIALGATGSKTIITLTSDIVCSGTLPTPNEFSGVLNGNGYSIVNAKLNNSHGLFHTLYGTISGLNLVNVQVNSSSIDSSEVGAFAGINKGNILKCSVSGSIVSGNWNTSSFCGTNSGKISDCYSTARISGGTRAGGIATVNDGTIENSFFAGTVTAKSDPCTIVFYNTGTLSNVYGLKGSASDSTSSDDESFVTADQLKTEEFLNKINSNSAWKLGTDHPVLADQKSTDEDFADLIASGSFYLDKDCTEKTDSAVVWVNGGTVKQADKSKINYKASVLYTDLKPEAVIIKGKSKTGKLQVAVTSTFAQPMVVKGKVTKDKAAEQIAKAKIDSKGKITVTAGKQAGTVYLWVYDLRADKTVGETACIEVTAKSAPYKISLFTDSALTTAAKNGTVALGSSAEIYFKSAADRNGAATPDAEFTVSVDAKSAAYVNAVLEGNKITITPTGLNSAKPGKVIKAKVTLAAKQNTRKVTYTVTIINPIVKVEALITDSSAKLAMKNDTATIKLTPSAVDQNFDTTAKIKLYVANSAPTIDEKGRIKVDKAKNITVKIDKFNVVTLKCSTAGACGVYAVYTTEKQSTVFKIADISADGTVTVPTDTSI